MTRFDLRYKCYHWNRNGTAAQQFKNISSDQGSQQILSEIYDRVLGPATVYFKNI